MRLPISLALFFTLVFSNAAVAANDGIGWIPTWQQAIAEARQTNKPIMLMAGAPACAGVPGTW